MTKYRNSYFKIQAAFPKEWHFQSWSTWKREPKYLERWQTSDTDIPAYGEGGKTLFMSMLQNKRNVNVSVHPDAYFIMEVYSEKSDFDIFTAANFDYDELNRSVSIEVFLERECQVLSVVIDKKTDGRRFIKKIVWEEKPTVWLEVTIDAGSEECFYMANDLLKHIERF